jgi:hypothetical protein
MTFRNYRAGNSALRSQKTYLSFQKISYLYLCISYVLQNTISAKKINSNTATSNPKYTSESAFRDDSSKVSFTCKRFVSQSQNAFPVFWDSPGNLAEASKCPDAIFSRCTSIQTMIKYTTESSRQDASANISFYLKIVLVVILQSFLDFSPSWNFKVLPFP